MAFVNEYVSEEDIKKYQIDELWNQYWRERQSSSKMPEWRLDGSYKHSWTIDDERSIWFMLVCTVHSTEVEWSRSGYPEPTSERIFILHVDGINIEVRLNLSEKSSWELKDVPFKRIWDYISMEPESLLQQSQKELIAILKEALTIFGYDGIYRQVPNTIVEFSF